MADNEEGEATVPRGNEWEVVSLTASAYAAAPGPQQVDSTQVSQVDSGGEHEVETSSAMFMSGHFVFPPSQHENLPVGSEYSEISEKEIEDDIDNHAKSNVKDEENVGTEGFTSDGIHMFDDKGNMISLHDAELVFDKEQSIYSTSEFNVSHHEVTVGKSKTVEEGESTDDLIQPLDEHLDSGVLNLGKHGDVDDDGADLPCEAWWKRRAVSLYAHAKEANTFWSICIAAAVMGLVIIGRRWHDSHLKGLCGIHDERMGRVIGPISRFKDVIVGGNRRGSFVRGSTSVER